MINKLQNCRICKNIDLTDVINLGEQIITSRFPVYGDFSTPKTEITLCMCNNCGLIQLKETTNPSEMYEYEYGYRSGISNTMKEHLLSYQQEILSKINIKDGDVIVDIGSNDSTMLQLYNSNIRRIGVDPTGKQFKEYYGDVELLANYFTYDNFINEFGEIKCKMISSISMFYDLPDPVQFAKDIYNILEPDGIWTCEQSYLLTMLRRNSIDTICHEHLEYYALHQIKEIADRSGFKIIDIKFNDCNGGSFRIYFAKKESIIYNENIDLINTILKDEDDYDIKNPKTYKVFMDNCDKEVKYLREFIQQVNLNYKKVYVYGASTKGNCLLQYANLGEEMMKYAVERNPRKIGKMTNTGIEIISEEKMRENPPEYLLVLPWHFKDEIISREQQFLDNGGQLIFPFPNFEIVSLKPKLLITGCDGLIAHYVKEQFNDYTLYGFGRSKSTDRGQLVKIIFDMNDDIKLEHYLEMIKPDTIIHLASISSSHYAFYNPVETLKTNGLLTAQLCDIIHKKKWNTKLFNASSSEMYKGHLNYTVDEDDSYMHHLHPYSIAKIMGHSIIDFYRNTYNHHFSNGIIFTTESFLKSPVFLLNKVSQHIRQWNLGDKQLLTLGNLDSYKNILHAKDVVNAIKIILNQNKGDDYVICNYEKYKILDLVLQLYSKGGIDLVQIENKFVENKTGMNVFIIENNKLEIDQIPINILGNPTKLKSLGWDISVSIDNILSELLLI